MKVVALIFAISSTSVSARLGKAHTGRNLGLSCSECDNDNKCGICLRRVCPNIRSRAFAIQEGRCDRDIDMWRTCVAGNSECGDLRIGECDGLTYYERVPCDEPEPILCSQCDNGNACGICLELVTHDSDCPDGYQSLRRCTSTLNVGDYCEADGNECGTTDTSGGACGAYEVYRRLPRCIEDDEPHDNSNLYKVDIDWFMMAGYYVGPTDPMGSYTSGWSGSATIRVGETVTPSGAEPHLKVTLKSVRGSTATCDVEVSILCCTSDFNGLTVTVNDKDGSDWSDIKTCDCGKETGFTAMSFSHNVKVAVYEQ